MPIFTNTPRPVQTRTGSDSGVSQETLDAALAILADAPYGTELNVTESVPTLGTASTAADRLKNALADRGVFTAGTSWTVQQPPIMRPKRNKAGEQLFHAKTGQPLTERDPDQPSLYGLTKVTREAYRGVQTAAAVPPKPIAEAQAAVDAALDAIEDTPDAAVLAEAEAAA